MKKRMIRLMATVMVCVLCCTSLCGCSAIDELRASVVTVVDANTVEWNGVKYKLIDDTLLAGVDFDSIDFDHSVYVNPDGVPVLLMSFLCASYNPTENKVFLTGYGAYWGENTRFDYSSYCREDRYNDVVRQLNEGLDLTGFLYSYYDAEDGEEHNYRFSKEECEAFRESVSPMNRWTTPVYSSEWPTTVYAYTEDGLLDSSMYEIIQDNGAYYIVHYPPMSDYDSDLGFDDEAYEDAAIYYRVPQEYYELFNKMLADSLREYTEWYSDMNEWNTF